MHATPIGSPDIVADRVPWNRYRAPTSVGGALCCTQQQTWRLWWLSWIRIGEQAVRRIGFRRPEPRIEAEPRPAIGAENRVLLAHVDVDVRVIVRRRNAHAVEFPHADSDLRDRAVVPE